MAESIRKRGGLGCFFLFRKSSPVKHAEKLLTFKVRWSGSASGSTLNSDVLAVPLRGSRDQPRREQGFQSGLGPAQVGLIHSRCVHTKKNSSAKVQADQPERRVIRACQYCS